MGLVKEKVANSNKRNLDINYPYNNYKVKLLCVGKFSRVIGNGEY